MNKRWLLRFLLLALLGGAVGGGITYAWWMAAERYGIAPGPFVECTFFTGFALMLIGLLCLTGGGATSVNLTSTPGTGGGPLQFFSSDKRLAKDVVRANTRRAELPGTTQVCVMMGAGAVTCFVPTVLTLVF